MKRRKFLLFASVALIIMSLAFVILPVGSPGGKTGSPIDGSNCTSCHGGSAVALAGLITTNIPAEGYLPGQNYNITVSATSSENKGFEITAETASAKIGTFIAGAGSKLTNSNKAVTHSSVVSSNSATWNLTWTAPSQSSGGVTFYAAVVLGKPNIKLSTLQVIEKSTDVEISINEKGVSVYPNPAKETINFTIANPMNAKYQIYSYDGKLIISGKAAALNTVNINSIVSGTYILKISDGNQVISKRFIKE